MTCPPRSGYISQEGAMLSPDGHTRTFSAEAQGTVFSDGAAVVLLKRLADAIADSDPVLRRHPGRRGQQRWRRPRRVSPRRAATARRP